MARYGGMMFQMRKLIDMDTEELLALRAACMDHAVSIRPEVQSQALREAVLQDTPAAVTQTCSATEGVKNAEN